MLHALLVCVRVRARAGPAARATFPRNFKTPSTILSLHWHGARCLGRPEADGVRSVSLRPHTVSVVLGRRPRLGWVAIPRPPVKARRWQLGHRVAPRFNRDAFCGSVLRGATIESVIAF